MRHYLWRVVLVSVAIFSSAQAQVKLEPKFVEGTKSVSEKVVAFHQIIKSKVTTDIESSSKQFQEIVSEIGSRQPDGTLPISIHFGALRAEFRIEPDEEGVEADNFFVFDSQNPMNSKGHKQFDPHRDFFRVLAKSRWTTTVDKNNHIQSLDFDENYAEQVAKEYKSGFDSQLHLRGAQQELAPLPAKPVQPGDVWECMWITDLAKEQSFNSRRHFTYLGTVEQGGRTLDKIVFRSDIATTAPERADTADYPILILRSAEGMLLFDRALGRFVESNEKLHIVGRQKIAVTTEGDIFGDVDQTVETKTVVRR